MSDRHRTELLEWLSPGDEHSTGKHGSIVERRVEKTGAWFINEFEEWLKDDSKMLLLGTGKRISKFMMWLISCSWCRKIIFDVSFPFSDLIKVYRH
jgi:hypothetical protein